MTWSVQDPSLSHATSRPIRNILGYPGAIGADLLMQIIGLGAIMLILPVAVWGWRMLTHRTFDREALRIACWILGTVISAGFASCWTHGGAWPLPTGLGGVVGDALVRAPAVVFGPPGLVYRLVLGVILFAGVVATFLFASGMGSRPQEAELTRDRGRRRAVRGRRRSRLGLAGMGFSCRHERESTARVAVFAGLSFAGGERADAAHGLVRTPGAESRRPLRAVAGPAGRRGFRRRRRGRRGSPHRPRAAQEGRSAYAPAQTLREIRTAFGVGADGAESLGPAGAEQIGARGQFAGAGKRARRFRRARRNRQGASRSRRDAVRTRTRTRHQVVARHRARRRHRALDERAVGPRCRGPRPQRHRHRTAQRASRKGLSARIAHGQGRIGRQAAALPRQEHRRRIRSSSTSRGRRIC